MKKILIIILSLLVCSCSKVKDIGISEEKNYDIDEFKLDKAAIELFSSANKPILGICGGLQSINVCFGGSLNQKIENHNLKDALHTIKIKKQRR